MRKAQLPTNAMNFLIRNVDHARTSRFYAKRRNPLFTQPARCVNGEPWSTVPIVCSKSAPIMICKQEDGIALLNFKSRLGEGALQIGWLNQIQQTLIRQVQ